MVARTQNVDVHVLVSLPKELVDEIRKTNDIGQYISDEHIVMSLAEDILWRYFNEEYFDYDSIRV